MDQRQADQSKHFIVAGLIITTGVLFTAIQVQQSAFRGQLSLPITYDDIVYFTDSVGRLNRFYDGGLLRLILDFIQFPAHSPTSTFTTMLGFSVLGVRDWAPAVANGLWVIAFLSFVAYVTSHLFWLYRVAIGAVVLASPLLGHLVVESRPDVLCGLTTACAAFLILQLPHSSNKRKHQIVAGVIGGLAFLAKPSISPITAIILLSALGFSALRDWLYIRHEADSIPKKKRHL